MFCHNSWSREEDTGARNFVRRQYSFLRNTLFLIKRRLSRFRAKNFS